MRALLRALIISGIVVVLCSSKIYSASSVKEQWAEAIAIETSLPAVVANIIMEYRLSESSVSLQTVKQQLQALNIYTGWIKDSQNRGPDLKELMEHLTITCEPLRQIRTIISYSFPLLLVTVASSVEYKGMIPEYYSSETDSNRFTACCDWSFAFFNTENHTASKLITPNALEGLCTYPIFQKEIPNRGFILYFCGAKIKSFQGLQRENTAYFEKKDAVLVKVCLPLPDNNSGITAKIMPSEQAQTMYQEWRDAIRCPHTVIADRSIVSEDTLGLGYPVGYGNLRCKICPKPQETDLAAILHNGTRKTISVGNTDEGTNSVFALPASNTNNSKLRVYAHQLSRVLTVFSGTNDEDATIYLSPLFPLPEAHTAVPKRKQPAVTRTGRGILQKPYLRSMLLGCSIAGIYILSKRFAARGYRR